MPLYQPKLRSHRYSCPHPHSLHSLPSCDRIVVERKPRFVEHCTANNLVGLRLGGIRCWGRSRRRVLEDIRPHQVLPIEQIEDGDKAAEGRSKDLTHSLPGVRHGSHTGMQLLQERSIESRANRVDLQRPFIHSLHRD